MIEVDYIEARRTRSIRWVCAAMFAFLLHAGAVFAILHSRTDEDEDVAGAIAIELAPITATQALTSAEIAPGPLMQEEAPAPETRKQTKETVAEEMPRVEPAPLAPDPAVQVPEPQPEKKQDEKADEKAAAKRESLQALAAPMTTAPPPTEVKASDAVAAPAPGLSAAAAKAQATWQKSLVAHINRYKRYPEEARAHKIEGVVSVEFTLDHLGQIVSSRVAHSSGSVVLDAEAIAMLRRAAPLPTPPEEAPPAGLQLTLPVNFQLK